MAIVPPPADRPRGPVPPAGVVGLEQLSREVARLLARSHDGAGAPKSWSYRSHRPLRPHTPAATAPPLIGIVSHELHAESERAWAPALGRHKRDRVPQRLSFRLTYTQAVQEAGGIAVVVPAHGYLDDTAALLDRLDGLVFSGDPTSILPRTAMPATRSSGRTWTASPTSTSSRCWPPPPSATFRCSASAAACRR